MSVLTGFQLMAEINTSSQRERCSLCRHICVVKI